MSDLVGSVSSHRYEGHSTIKFSSDDQKGLSVTVDTEHLHIRSIKAKDLDRYAALFADQEVMEKYANGQPRSRDEVAARVNGWVKRWFENDPYSALAVFKKNTKDFVGHVILGHGDHPGEAELAGLGNRSFWDKGYGSEAASVIVQEYAPATVQEGYFLEGKPLEKIVATARMDNPASSRILERIGMHSVYEGEKHEGLRKHYSIDLIKH